MTIMYRLGILFKNAFWSDGLYRHVQMCKRTELSVEPVPKLAESVMGWRLYTVWDGQKPEMHCLGENSCQLFWYFGKKNDVFAIFFNS